MRTNRYRAVSVVFSVFFVIATVAFLVMKRTAITDIIATATALVGALAIWFQMKRARDMEEGSFIVGLNESFLSSDGIRAIYRKLVSNTPLTEDDRVEIVEYLTFFETIYVLLERGLVEISVLDELFSYRFFLAVNNPDIQRLELICDAPYYKNLYALDYTWSTYRRKHGKTVQLEGSLAQCNQDYYNFVKV